MIRRKASITALILAATTMLSVYVLYKPSDHEAVSESPTVQIVVVPPIDDIPKSAVVHKPLKTVKTEDKPSQQIKKVEAKPKTVSVEATFYVATCKGCSGITKMGDNVKRTIYVNGMRVIAADPNVIPLGSIVEVALEDGTTFKASVRDVGGGIKGARIDVLVASKKEAYRLGRQQATITIIEMGGR